MTHISGSFHCVVHCNAIQWTLCTHHSFWTARVSCSQHKSRLPFLNLCQLMGAAYSPQLVCVCLYHKLTFDAFWLNSILGTDFSLNSLLFVTLVTLRFHLSLIYYLLASLWYRFRENWFLFDIAKWQIFINSFSHVFLFCQVDPMPFLKMCLNSKGSDSKDPCITAVAYLQACLMESTPLRIPDICVKYAHLIKLPYISWGRVEHI
jgi:hypothetical protein